MQKNQCVWSCNDNEMQANFEWLTHNLAQAYGMKFESSKNNASYTLNENHNGVDLDLRACRNMQRQHEISPIFHRLITVAFSQGRQRKTNADFAHIMKQHTNAKVCEFTRQHECKFEIEFQDGCQLWTIFMQI